MIKLNVIHVKKITPLALQKGLSFISALQANLIKEPVLINIPRGKVAMGDAETVEIHSIFIFKESGRHMFIFKGL